MIELRRTSEASRRAADASNRKPRHAWMHKVITGINTYITYRVRSDFFIHFFILDHLVSLCTARRDAATVLNGEFRRTWKLVIVTYFKLLFRNFCFSSLRGDHKNLRHKRDFLH